MPTVRIKDESKLIKNIEVTQETLAKVQDFVNDTKTKARQVATIDGINFRKEDYYGYVSTSSEIIQNGYDIRNPEHVRILREFETELSDYKARAALKRDLSYYGTPVSRTGGYVRNAVLGTVHWSEVEYCLEKKLVGKYPQNNWFIHYDTDAGLTTNLNTANKFSVFLQKKSGLDKLNLEEEDRRKAEQQNDAVTSNL